MKLKNSKSFKFYTLIIFLLYTTNALAGDHFIKHLNQAFKTTWTYTYLKAKDGKHELMREYIKKNWFAMDKQAVDNAVIRDYLIIDNQNRQQNPNWDFIVAVEYFGNETYSDIAKEFEVIRKKHITVPIEGFSREDFNIVRSELVSIAEKFKGRIGCNEEHLKAIEPFLGIWLEVNKANRAKTPFGLLEFSIDPVTCVAKKRFNLLGKDGGYSTSAFVNPDTGMWTETFNNGVQFQWTVINGTLYKYILSKQSPNNRSRRNQWSVVNKGFMILEQYSNDNGKTWHNRSETIVKRR